MVKKECIIEKIKKNKKIQYFIIATILCLGIIFFIANFQENKNVANNSSFIDSYVSNLENKLANTLSNVKGAGKINIVITVESGMETVLAMKTTTTINESGKKEIVETPILVNGKTVVLKENYPKIIGVLIVCEGADNLMTLSKIQQATVSLLDIKLEQIEILSMK